jgi:hypothetical protein
LTCRVILCDLGNFTAVYNMQIMSKMQDDDMRLILALPGTYKRVRSQRHRYVALKASQRSWATLLWVKRTSPSDSELVGSYSLYAL